MGFGSVSSICALVLAPIQPIEKVNPQGTFHALNGGVSMVFVQLLLDGVMPQVPRLSLTLGLNGMLWSTAALYNLIMSRKPHRSTPSSFSANPSSVFALTLVTCLMRYSSRTRCETFASNTCQANCCGC